VNNAQLHTCFGKDGFYRFGKASQTITASDENGLCLVMGKFWSLRKRILPKVFYSERFSGQY